MILVDSRAGSCELVAPLAAAGLPVEETTLEFGDVAFMGRGIGGAEVFIGIEHKKLGDLVQSLASDRLAGHQLPGMVETYDRPHLIIEGDWHVNSGGRVVQTKWRGRAPVFAPMKGAPPALELEKRIITLATRGGLTVRWTKDQKTSVRYIHALYRFWTDHDLDEHKSHLAIHAPDFDSSVTAPVSLLRVMAAQLPGVGYQKSAAVEAHFGSVWQMVNAPEVEWLKVEGIGKKLAKQIHDVVRVGKGK